MQSLWDVLWHRFNIILSVVSDTNARAIAVLFYFTILVPFGMGSTLFSDPFRKKIIIDEAGKQRPSAQEWAKRDPVPNDLNSARQQG